MVHEYGARVKNFIDISNLRVPITVGTRVHFMRDGEISEGSVVVLEVVGNTILFDDPIPVDAREGDQLISFVPES
jgi:hypothetical protein